MRRPHELWQRGPGTAKRVLHRVLVSKKGVAAVRRRLEPGECVVRRAHEACVRKWCSCAEGMRARVSSTLHKGWRGRNNTWTRAVRHRGSRGGLRYELWGGVRCVQGRPEAPLRLSSSSSSMLQKTEPNFQHGSKFHGSCAAQKFSDGANFS